MNPTLGKKPHTERPLMVQFRNGETAGPYFAHMIRWTDTDYAFDVVAAEFADKRKAT